MDMECLRKNLLELETAKPRRKYIDKEIAYVRRNDEFYKIEIDYYPQRNGILLIPRDPVYCTTLFLHQTNIMDFHKFKNTAIKCFTKLGTLELRFSTKGRANDVMELLQKITGNYIDQFEALPPPSSSPQLWGVGRKRRKEGNLKTVSSYGR